MKTIMVFDVPAESGGALSVLNDFYNEVSQDEDKSINWIFIVSMPQLKEKKNIKVLKYPYVKRSWLHRQYFDMFVSPLLIRKYKADKVFSLQNMVIPFTKVKQILYVHQSLPFIEYKFSFKENKLFWIYQNIIGKKIIKSMKVAERVIVQTKWIKKAIVQKSHIKSQKIQIVPPSILINIDNFFENEKESLATFFYPASAFSYKNHKIIVEACKLLVKKTNKKFKVILTLVGDENETIIKLHKEIKLHNLPIFFVGNLSREDVFKLFTESILLFPSYIETFGLPLLEARLHRGVIFASDSPFSYEILEGYENSYFFDPFKPEELSSLMLRTLNSEIHYIDPVHDEKTFYKSSKLIKHVTT